MGFSWLVILKMSLVYFNYIIFYIGVYTYHTTKRKLVLLLSYLYGYYYCRFYMGNMLQANAYAYIYIYIYIYKQWFIYLYITYVTIQTHTYTHIYIYV